MIYFCGDVHGGFDHILPAIGADDPHDGQPKAVIFLGDLEPKRPLEEEIQPLLDAGVEVWFIHGNHDSDSPKTWDNLLGSWHRNLHGRVVTIQGLRVAGLGGVFRGEVWYPAEAGAARFGSYDEYESDLRRRQGVKRRLSKLDLVQRQAAPGFQAELLDQSKVGRLLRHQSTIFPDTYDALGELGADVLVTHEAPSCHPHGFAAIDLLAQVMGVQAVFHGHHHDSLDYRAWDARLSFRAYGVGFCGITTEDGRVVQKGELDEARSGRGSPSTGHRK